MVFKSNLNKLEPLQKVHCGSIFCVQILALNLSCKSRKPACELELVEETNKEPFGAVFFNFSKVLQLAFFNVN